MKKAEKELNKEIKAYIQTLKDYVSSSN